MPVKLETDASDVGVKTFKLDQKQAVPLVVQQAFDAYKARLLRIGEPAERAPQTPEHAEDTGDAPNPRI